MIPNPSHPQFDPALWLQCARDNGCAVAPVRDGSIDFFFSQRTRNQELYDLETRLLQELRQHKRAIWEHLVALSEFNGPAGG